MKTLRLITFALITIYGVTLFLKKTGVLNSGFFCNYFTDLLCLPIILGVGFLLSHWLKPQEYPYLKIEFIIATVIIVAVLFEWILPKYSMHHTGDWIDVGMYCLGALSYYWYQLKLLNID